jgi:molecular chaperone DnaK (HSP70)
MQAPFVHQENSAALGIDFGATRSAMASLNVDGIPTLVMAEADGDRSFDTETAVAVAGKHVAVGNDAVWLAEDDPQSDWRTDFCDHLGSGLKKRWSADAMTESVIKKLKERSMIEGQVCASKPVFAISGAMTATRRRGLRRAARRAGWHDAALVESTLVAARWLSDAAVSGSRRAAVIANRSPSTILVCDLGAKHADVGLIQVDDQRMRMVATQFDDGLRSESIDVAIVQEWMTSGALRGRDPQSTSRLLGLGKWMANLLRRKWYASPDVVPTLRTYLDGMPCELVLPVGLLARLEDDYLQRVHGLIEQCLSDAAMQADQPDGVHLIGAVGGSPRIASSIGKRWGSDQGETPGVHRPYAAAYGACMASADRIEGRQHAYQPTARCDLAVQLGAAGLQTAGSNTIGPNTVGLGSARLVPLIRRGTPLPKRACAVMKTTRPNQPRLVVDVVEALHGEVVGKIGTYVFAPLNAPSAGHPIEVTVDQDIEGIVQVTAVDGVTKQTVWPLIDGGPGHE